MNTNTTHNPNTPANGNSPITVRYPNVILDDNNKIATSYLDNGTPATTPNNGKITVSQNTNTTPQSYPNVIPNNPKITLSQNTDNGIITAQNNGKITASNAIQIDPYDLSTKQGTLQSLQTCLDDIGIVLSLVIHEANPTTARALARLMQIGAETWSDIAQSEIECLDEYLDGTQWERKRNGGQA
ncbi:hypothetical protein LP123_05825 [Moraxella bovis]|uniref:Uncharacterized protein n=1 Tax=Moraxella bovis TaxID=476 RepID=A0AAX3EYR1_MORBO|nr:hypothetical protein [Moraxella bovis]AWY20064.1 hypothetical protein DQF64_05830 [Moraxella bovis]UYZ80143.1 hypothetical protein LP113_08790 [Moraxella bovis]UYZ90474.1 hypothetical protein LP114_05225 [Moraxella bovis]UYZ94341.1 hypothetical protein LP121_10725 [Moraxella bovis]UZA05201.1 hypothetical protein LP099_08480 [Moraxella bovis]